MLCACGCGQPTTVAKRTNRARGIMAGEPNRFLLGHSGVLCQRHLRKDGYVLLRMPEHPRAADGFVLEHIVVIERLLDRDLPEPVVIHHVGEKHENGPGALVVLENQAEHLSLHRRLRVLRAGGNPWTDWLCTYCRLPKPRDQFYAMKNGSPTSHCRACRLARSRVSPEKRKRTWTRRKAVA